ncbi:hypothetical protein [Nonomuraea guangzhouensis]|uniref:Uncharacterized protein n=1 Tax=Nonomuraea guangzhouensis TaxID=1291555 RepID=A0ABW4GHP6_9ACTN|nr:hypothetical protein [Nonomuraea guangzhouensis]
MSAAMAAHEAADPVAGIQDDALPPDRPVSARGGYVQVPSALLRSPLYGALSVAAWAMYETLMPRGLDGGRAPARARRCWVADALGVSEKTLDGARRELLADVAGGPWLARSSPLGAKRAVRHAALRLPRDTGDSYVKVPAWTLDLLSASCEAGRRISPSAWRLYALLLVNRGRADQPLETSVGYLGGLTPAAAGYGNSNAPVWPRSPRAAAAACWCAPCWTRTRPQKPPTPTPHKAVDTPPAPRTPEHSPLAKPGSHPWQIRALHRRHLIIRHLGWRHLCLPPQATYRW